MKLTVKNLLPYRYGVNTTQGITDLEPGEEAELDFADNEAKAISMNSAFAVKGYNGGSETEEKPDLSGAAKDAETELARLKTENGTLKSANKDLETQLSDIAGLFGTNDVDATNVRAAVEKLIQDQESLLNQQANSAPDTGSGSTDLASAVQQLDDKNDEQWTQSGKPRLSALSAIMGSEVTAAQYDALPDDQKRNRA